MKINSFEDATAVVIRVNSIVALRNPETPANKGRFLLVWLYDILILCSIILCKLWIDARYLPMKTQKGLFELYILWSINFCFTYVCTISLGLYHSKDTLTLKKTIAIVDDILRELKSAINYRNIFNRVIVTGIIFTFYGIYQFALLMSRMLRVEKGLISFLFVFLSIFCFNNAAIVVFDFLTYIFWLELRFKQTNDVLKTFHVDGRQIKTKRLNEYAIKVTKNRNRLPRNFNAYTSEFFYKKSQIVPPNRSSSLDDESPVAKKIHFLQEVRFVHLQLCNIAKMVNKIFNAQLMLQSINTMLYLSVLLYVGYSEISTQSGNVLQLVKTVLIYFIELITYIWKFSQASHCCERTTKEANKIRETILTMSVHEFDTEIKDEIHQFSLQISLNQVLNSKPSFFQLNYTFERQCLSFVITYLIILIQWGPNFALKITDTIKNETIYNGNRTFPQR